MKWEGVYTGGDLRRGGLRLELSRMGYAGDPSAFLFRTVGFKEEGPFHNGLKNMYFVHRLLDVVHN